MFELVKNIFTSPFSFFYPKILDLCIKINLYYQDLNQRSPEIVDQFVMGIDIIAIVLRFYYIFFLLRLLLLWFPAINPYVAPQYTVMTATDPPLDFVAKRLPLILGMDFSFILVTTAITVAIEQLDKIQVYTKTLH